MTTEYYLVAGLGKTGLSIARYLHKRQYPFMVYDSRENPTSLTEFTQEFPDVSYYLKNIPEAIVNRLTAIVTSPGVSLDLPLFQTAKKVGIPVYGDIECLARSITAPVIAITGTNGKSTVTTLVGEMAAKAGYKVAVAGNIGDPVLDKLDDGQSYDLWVLELSSFQLDLTQSLAPVAATILNISPDHLDRHHTLSNYIAAKQSIYQRAKVQIFNRQDQETLPQIGNGNTISFGEDAPIDQEWGLINKAGTTYLAQGKCAFLAVDDLHLKGVHNWQNALAACALAAEIGISREHQIEVLRDFTGLPHRCQWIRQLDRVDWINDSKGTNIGATISAIAGIGAAIQGKIVLIAGGQGKGADFTDLQASVKDYVRSVILIGEDADKMAQALTNTVPIVHAQSLEEAVLQAQKAAQPDDVVLLSPACASLDMFKDFNHRGDVFTALVQQL